MMRHAVADMKGCVPEQDAPSDMPYPSEERGGTYVWHGRTILTPPCGPAYTRPEIPTLRLEGYVPDADMCPPTRTVIRGIWGW